MALEVLHQQAATHENEQFRRVVKIIKAVFEKHGYDGILIGNPFNEHYRRFRADAILFFNHGVVIIDFKDYSGQLNIPYGDDEFKNLPWYAENTLDHQVIEVKAGAHFLNPFRQLASYRSAFKEIVEYNPIFKQKIDPTRLCIANIFSGPLELSNKIPGKYPYYKIAQESEIGALLYDLNNDNAFDEDIAKAVKNIFPADEYVQDYSFETEVIRKQDIIVGEEAKATINTFMQADSNDILILTSMDVVERDNWAKYIFSISDNYEIPEVHGLCHSNRISCRLRQRGIEASSLYSFIYRGNERVDNMPVTEGMEENDDLAVQIIPLRLDDELDERALLIVYDAHLVSRSLSQSDMLRFGSGRLLEDFITFAKPSSKRKIVFIGDPYMLSFGSSDDSAVNLMNLRMICEDRVIHYYHQPVHDSYDSRKESLRCSLANSIDAQLFNNLNYAFDDGSIVKIEKDAIANQMKEWFVSPFQQEPKQAVLFFKKSDCQKTNLWIKNHCLNNGKELAVGDLLIANNNINIPDETGFEIPKRVLNGMYFTVQKILEEHSETIFIKNSHPIILFFKKIYVRCLSLELNGKNVELWVLDNYLNCEDELSKEEQIAVQVFIKQRIEEQKKSTPFIKSNFYRQLTSDLEYQAFSNDKKEAIESLIQNRMVSEDKVSVNTKKAVRSLLKRYYDKYESEIQRSIRENDSLVNPLYAKYAWAITVHKAIGLKFDNVILKGFRTENDGMCNEAYFRWLYSGVSASSGTFYIAQPQYIHPFMNCMVSETNSGVNPPKQLLIYDGYRIPSRFSKILSLKNINTSAAICELARIIEPNGYILAEVKPCSDFLIKAVFSIPQDSKKKMVIDFHNKGAKDSFGVSRINLEPNSAVDSIFIQQSIETIFSQSLLCNKSTACPNYIMEIVNVFIEQMQERGIKIQTIDDSKDYQIICKAISNNGDAMLRLWFGTSLERHNKGFINKIDVFNITDTVIMDEIQRWVNKNSTWQGEE